MEIVGFSVTFGHVLDIVYKVKDNHITTRRNYCKYKDFDIFTEGELCYISKKKTEAIKYGFDY